jgi:hypothetical protein
MVGIDDILKLLKVVHIFSTVHSYTSQQPFISEVFVCQDIYVKTP